MIVKRRTDIRVVDVPWGGVPAENSVRLGSYHRAGGTTTAPVSAGQNDSS